MFSQTLQGAELLVGRFDRGGELWASGRGVDAETMLGLGFRLLMLLRCRYLGERIIGGGKVVEEGVVQIWEGVGRKWREVSRVCCSRLISGRGLKARGV